MSENPLEQVSPREGSVTTKKQKGLYEIDEEDLTPRFQRVMQNEGFTFDELKPKTRKEIIEIIKNKDPLGTKINEELVQALQNHLESRRMQKIDLIRKEKSTIEVPKADKLNESITLNEKSIILEKSIIMDRSIMTQLNKSTLIKQMDPNELEFKLYDKIKKKERAELHKAQKEEEDLVRQVEYEHKQRLLEERLNKRRQELNSKKKISSQQKQELQDWFEKQRQINPDALEDHAMKRQIYMNFMNEYKEIEKQKLLLNPRQPIEKITTKKDLQMKEIEDLRIQREKNLQAQLQKLADLANAPNLERGAFNEQQRQVQKLLRDERLEVRKLQQDEYRSYIRTVDNQEKEQANTRIVRNLTLINLNHQMKIMDLDQKAKHVEQRLEKFQELQEQSLKRQRAGDVYLGTKSLNHFSMVKQEFEKRIGFQENLIKELDKNENIQRKLRQEAQAKEKLQIKKQSQSIASQMDQQKKMEIFASMKQFESQTMRSTIKSLESIKIKHIAVDSSLSVEEQKKQEEEARRWDLMDKKEYEKRKQRYRKQIDEEKERIRLLEESKKQESEQQQQQ